MNGGKEFRKVKFDLPQPYIRAIRVRAGFDNVNPRDVVMAALDGYLGHELADVKQRMKRSEPPVQNTRQKKARAKGS